MPIDAEIRFLIILGYFLFRDDRQMRNDFSLVKSENIDIGNYVNNRNIDIVIKALFLYFHYMDFYNSHFCFSLDKPDYYKEDDTENYPHFQNIMNHKLSFDYGWHFTTTKMSTTINKFLKEKFRYEKFRHENLDVSNEVYTYSFHENSTLKEFNQNFNVNSHKEACKHIVGTLNSFYDFDNGREF